MTRKFSASGSPLSSWCFVLILFGCTSNETSTQESPNVILIMVNDGGRVVKVRIEAVRDPLASTRWCGRAYGLHTPTPIPVRPEPRRDRDGPVEYSELHGLRRTRFIRGDTLWDPLAAAIFWTLLIAVLEGVAVFGASVLDSRSAIRCRRAQSVGRR